MAVQSPVHFDIVGSFLRPERLKKAREAFRSGTLGQAGLRRVEDEEIRKLISKEKALGLRTLTDGEFRREYWHLDFMWGLGGIKRETLSHGYFFEGEETGRDTAVLTGKLSGDHHPIVDDFRFTQQFAYQNTVVKETLPAPAHLLDELYREENAAVTKAIYPDEDALIDDIVAAYRTVIRDLYDAGCRCLQLDDCTWAMLCDTKYWTQRQGGTENLKVIAERHLTINNRVLEDQPFDLVISTHVCRGNYHSTWAARGGYLPIAPLLFAREKVHTLYLEFDDERSGGFAPLRYVSPDKTVVLGLVTTKRPDLEDPERIRERIKEAAQYVPLSRLSLSPQCGFASTEIGNKLTEEDQWKKIALVRDIAQTVWG